MNAESLFFFWGCAGAACDELLHWAALRQRKAFPTYVRSVKYWIVTALLVLMGGLVATAAALSRGTLATPIATLVVGFGAPALLKKLVKALLQVPLLGGATESARPTVLGFLSD